MRQSIKVDARRVVINNTDKRVRGRSARAVREVVGNDHVLAAIDLLRKDLNSRPQGVQLGPIGEPGLVADVTSAVSPDASLLGLQSRLDVRQRLFHRPHETSSPSAAATGATVPAPPARVEERAPSPSGVDATTAAASAPGAPTPPAAVVAPTIYYQDRLVTLYHGDSLAAPELWIHADVLITDPPYGLGGIAGAYGMSHRTIENDLDTTVRDRVLDLWGDKPAAVFATPRLEEPPGGWRDRLVWDKQQLGLNGGPWRYAHEMVYVRGDGWIRTSDAASSILRVSSQSNRKHVRNHIHSKPEKVLADLIAAAPEGIIVDTFAGGGSTVAAAKALGRQVIAFELDEAHCATIVERITSRIDLFGGDA